MERPAPKTGGVKHDPPAPAAEDAPETEPVRPVPPRPVPTAWRVVMLLWVTAFAFLAAYELLYTTFKLLKIRD
jgi:hypothetical protein